MKYIVSKSRDVYYNLALEEYIFEQYRTGDVLILSVNQDAVVLGRNQNLFEETCAANMEALGISIARRITGGGTVFHDDGNLNYTLICDYNTGISNDCTIFILPVIEILKKMGVQAEKQRISDIAIEGRKISGSAQTIKKNRILHHGTLLLRSDLKKLDISLKPTNAEIESKAVQSVRSKTGNIIEYLEDKEITTDLLSGRFLEHFRLCKNDELVLRTEELDEIESLAETKYRSWDWVYGKSPNFTVVKNGTFCGYPYCIRLMIAKGITVACQIDCNAFDTDRIENLLTGERYLLQAFRDKLSGLDFEENPAQCFF